MIMYVVLIAAVCLSIVIDFIIYLLSRLYRGSVLIFKPKYISNLIKSGVTLQLNLWLILKLINY